MDQAAGSDRRIFVDAASLSAGAAEWLFERAMASTGRFAVCCSGGSTPRGMYERLAKPDIAARFPWDRVHWFWGDERFVPHDHPDSNYGMTRAALLSRATIPSDNIHAVPTAGLTPEQAADAYQAVLQKYYGAHRLDATRPLFDVVLLGIGDDGHTASLFPGNAAVQEQKRWVVAVIGAKSEARITLTLPVLDSSHHVVFLANGDRKRLMIERAKAGDQSLPSARVRPVGQLHWFIDQAAAGT